MFTAETKSKEAVFSDCLKAMYGAHGKALSTGAAMAAYEQLAHLPESFILWAKAEVYKLDSWPGNFSRYILSELLPKWQEKRGEKNAQNSMARGCHDCDMEMPGFITAWRHGGNRVIFRCMCNTMHGLDGMAQLSRNAISRLVDKSSPDGSHYFVPGPGARVTEVEKAEFPVSWQTSGNDANINAAIKVLSIDCADRKSISACMDR